MVVDLLLFNFSLRPTSSFGVVGCDNNLLSITEGFGAFNLSLKVLELLVVLFLEIPGTKCTYVTKCHFLIEIFFLRSKQKI